MINNRTTYYKVKKTEESETYNFEFKKDKYIIPYKLQFFADDSGGEKTEEASPKKISDAREEGQVAKSVEFVSGITLIVFFVSLKILLGYLGENFIGCFHQYYNYIELLAKEEVSTPLVGAVLQQMGINILKITLPIILIIFSVVLFTNIIQVQLKVTTKPLSPKLSSLSPISGFKRMFSKDKIVSLIRDIVKVIIIIYVAYNELISKLPAIFGLYDLEFYQATVLTGDIIINLGIKIGITYLIIGVLDFIYQKFKFKRDLRMTKQEVKEEFKQTEGNPQIKNMQKSRMREVSARRMMQDVPEADVIITNPTHFAVAIKYEAEAAGAPVLLAKGADHLANKIKDLAKESKVPIVENKPLARMLYYNVEIGDEIPPELYELTAQVLAYVYSLDGEGLS